MISIPHLLLSLLVAEGSGGQPEGSSPGEDLDIVSESDCPSSRAVREALARLRPPPDWPDASVTIRASQDSLSIELGEGSSIMRELAVGQSCADRASAAAFVIATWMDDLPAQATRAPILSAERPTVPSTPDVARCEIGAGLSAGANGGWAPGVHAEIIRRKPGHHLGWQVNLDVLGPHTVAVSHGNTHWMRTSLGAGLHGRLEFARFFLASDVGLAGAYTTAWGTGYTSNTTDGAFTWGPAAGLRVGLPWGRSRLWIDSRARWWAKGDSVQIDSPSAAWVESAELPRWEWQTSLGVGYQLSAP